MGALGDFIWTRYVPSVCRGPIGGKLFGVACIVADVCADMLLRAGQAGLIASPLSADDVLGKVGEERGGLFKFASETNAQYRARLLVANDTWDSAGDEIPLETQLRLAGFANATVTFHPERLGPRNEPAPYASQFWISATAYPHTGVAPLWGSITWGSFVWGTASLTVSDAALFWGIVNKFKPADHFCRGIELV